MSNLDELAHSLPSLAHESTDQLLHRAEAPRLELLSHRGIDAGISKSVND